METLSTTEPHYIRCIKPNAVLKPGIFENSNVLNQLRCGVSESPLLAYFPLIAHITNVSLRNYTWRRVVYFNWRCSGCILRQGVLEAIRISCAGYPTKRTFDEFLDRFGMLAPDVLDGYVSSNSTCIRFNIFIQKEYNGDLNTWAMWYQKF